MNPLEEEVGSAGRSARVFGTIVQWTIAAINAKGYSKIDPNKVILDKDTLRRVGKVVCVYSTKPIVQGAAALLELLARLLLLIIFLALSCTPKHRSVIVERVRMRLESSVNSVRGLGMLTGPGVQDGEPFGKSHLPGDAQVLIVGAGGVGKSSLACALQRLARKGGLGELSIAESHGPRLPELAALGTGLELVLIVWEAAQGTPLPAYVARYTHQLRRQLGGSAGSGAEGGSAEGDGGASSGSALEATEATGTSTTPAEEVAPAPAASTISRGPEAGPEEGGEVGSRPSRRQCYSGSDEGRAAAAAAGASAPAAEEATTRDEAAAVPPPPIHRAPRVLVVCNKCDSMPCPMPQIRGLPQTQAFIAVSAERGTNLAHLWSMVLPVLSSGGDDHPRRAAADSTPRQE